MDLFFKQKILFGEELQAKIRDTRVAIVGLGGIGSWLSISLAKLGVSDFVLFDRSIVDETDLHRQVYSLKDLYKKKVDALSEKLLEINKDIKIEKNYEFDEKIAIDTFKKVDILFDATDNIKTRKIINEASVITNKPWIFLSVGKYQGYAAIIYPDEYCFEDIFSNKVDCINSNSGIYIAPVLFVVSLGIQLFIDYLKNKENKFLYYFNLLRFKLYSFRIKAKEECEVHVKKRFKYIKWR